MVLPRRFFAAALGATLTLVLTAAAVASAQTTTVAPPADPGVGIRLLEAPENRRDDPRALRYIVDHLTPGTSITRSFEVSNGTDRQVTIPLYAVAATLQDDQFVPAGGRETNELASWMSITPSSVTLAPDGRATAKVTIAVPDDVDPGERYAVVIAELPPPPPAPGQTIAVVSRAGLRVYLSVGAGAEPPTSFRLDSFAPRLADDGTPVVTVDTCNTGGRALDLTGSLDLTDGPGGTSAGPFATEGATTLAPSECGTVDIPLRAGLPRGPWKATVTLRSGPRVRQAEATITFPVEPGTAAAPVQAKPKSVTGTAGGRLALLLALLLLLVVLGFLLWLLWRRRRRREEEQEIDQERRSEESAVPVPSDP